MNRLFLISFLVLAAASLATYWSLPEQQSDRPILYWAVLPDESKHAIRDAFYEWREEQGLPPVELRLDAANRDLTKKMIQGVSGVGSDIVDAGGLHLQPLQNAGVLLDVTDTAKKYGATPDKTYPSAVSEMIFGGRQYSFPRNVVANAMWVNVDTFARHGIEVPSRRWTIEEFERIGREFVAAANTPDTKSQVYFTSYIPRKPMRRSLGASFFNETLTRCTLDDPRNIELLRRVHQWVVVDQLAPSREAEKAFEVDGSGFRLKAALFHRGNYGLLYLGRWALIFLRELEPVQLAAVEPPHGGFPNIDINVGGVGVYAGSDQPDLAASFLGFLTSERYNTLVAETGDSLPPVPRFTESETYLRPVGYENEWGAHEVFSESARYIGIGQPSSPYVLSSLTLRIEVDAYDSMIAGRITPEESGLEAAWRINREIEITLSSNPALQPQYDEALERQARIDAYRAEGRPVPEAWIDNPFHRAYYRHMGWLAEDQTTTDAEEKL